MLAQSVAAAESSQLALNLDDIKKFFNFPVNPPPPSSITPPDSSTNFLCKYLKLFCPSDSAKPDGNSKDLPKSQVPQTPQNPGNPSNPNNPQSSSKPASFWGIPTDIVKKLWGDNPPPSWGISGGKGEYPIPGKGSGGSSGNPNSGGGSRPSNGGSETKENCAVKNNSECDSSAICSWRDNLCCNYVVDQKTGFGHAECDTSGSGVVKSCSDYGLSNECTSNNCQWDANATVPKCINQGDPLTPAKYVCAQEECTKKCGDYYTGSCQNNTCVCEKVPPTN